MTLTAPQPIHVECGRFNGVLGLIGDKWTVMIVLTLTERPRRFNDIKRTIGGISQQMLARTLRALERDGMVIRTVHPTIPPQVEYALSSLGHSLAHPVRALGSWAMDHIVEIEDNRSAFDVARGGGVARGRRRRSGRALKMPSDGLVRHAVRCEPVSP